MGTSAHAIAYKKKLYEQGLCTWCAAPRNDSRKLCEICSKKQSLALQGRVKGRIAEGLCRRCGSTRNSPYLAQTCLDCWFYETALNALGSAQESAGVKALFYQQDGKCAYTGVLLIPGVNASIDHKTPTARGGTKTLDNLQWITNDINHTKGAMCHEDFVAMCAGVVLRFPSLACIGIQSVEAPSFSYRE